MSGRGANIHPDRKPEPALVLAVDAKRGKKLTGALTARAGCLQVDP
jgi:hypothetical protein